MKVAAKDDPWPLDEPNPSGLSRAVSLPNPNLAPAPTLLTTEAWSDYGLIDSGGGLKLERYGQVQVIRPEPQAWWRPRHAEAVWRKAQARFDPTDEEDDGRWKIDGRAPPDAWTLRWDEVRFRARLTPFRHLAFFPEQAANWAFLRETVSIQAARAAAENRPFRVLNLFGYTGVASLVCAAAGAHVTHLDASKKSVGYARENAELSGLSAAPIRWVCEDARRYASRELKRGSFYDGIILDPPKYGRGPGGEVWRLAEDLPELADTCAKLLSDQAEFLIVNAYAARVSGLSLAHLLAEKLAGRGGGIDYGELALAEEAGDPCRAFGLSVYARWRRELG